MTADAEASPVARADPGPPDDVPFPGLRPFSERESDLFFGRETETATILDLLEQQQLVVVHGASGCGKSSVVRAGVVPYFRLDARANGTTAHVIIIRPADAGGPFQSLASKLERAFPRPQAADPDDDIPTWPELLAASPRWVDEINAAVAAADATLCLIIDQFEEIFAVSRSGYAAETRRLIEFLISLDVEAPAGTALGCRPLSVLLTMRSDYLGHCARWDGFAETVNRCQYLLPKISMVGLLHSIHEPAARRDATVDTAVADRLLPVIAREMDGLPVLQHALMRSWQVASPAWTGQNRVIGADALEAVGGAEHALSRHAEEAFAQATAGHAERVQTVNWIFRALSDLDSDGRIIRRPVRFANLIEETGTDADTARSILDIFRAPYFSLVMPYDNEPLEDDAIVSVSHEALLRQWSRISTTEFGEDGQPIGLVYREFQDGMIWRALTIQAQAYAKDKRSVLGPAATEQRLPWYREIARRPGWIARHLMRKAANDAEVEAQWRSVADFMAASETNLALEQSRLEAEKENVRKIRQSRRNLTAALAVIFILTIATIILMYRGHAMHLAAENNKLEQAKAVLDKDKSQLTQQYRTVANQSIEQSAIISSLQSSTAKALAERECIGSGRRDACPEEVYTRYLIQIQNRQARIGQTAPNANVPLSPYDGYGGGAVPPARTPQSGK